MMKKRILHTLLATLLLCFTTASAQTDYRQRQLTMDNGLPSNAVSCLLQDQRGYVWMGTEGGLCRYDGRVIKAYPLPDEAHDRITALLAVGDDELWVGTSKSLYRLLHSTEKYEQLEDVKITKPVTSLAQDHDGNLWVATLGQGIIGLSRDEKKPHNYAMADCDGLVNQVYADGDNQVWAVCSQGKGGLWRLNKNLNTFEPAQLANASEAPGDPTVMLQTADGRRWVATWEHGLWMLDKSGRMTTMPDASTGHLLHIHALSELQPGQLLVACDDGLWLFDTERNAWSLYLPQRFAQTVMRDSEGGLWVGTSYGGATYVSPLARRFEATPGELITDFAEDSHGRVWVTGDKGGIACYGQDHKRLAQYPGQSQLMHLYAHALAFDNDNLWIATYNDGLYVMNMASGRLAHYGPDPADDHALPDGSIHAIYRDSHRQIWVSTTEALCRYDRAHDRFDRIAPLASSAIDIDEDRQGRLWISTQGAGLLRLDIDGHTQSYRTEPRNERSLPNDIVNCTLVDPSGRIWVGTQGGLCQYDPDNDDFARVALNIPRQAVASIVEDQGVLWLSGDCGILKYMPGEGLQRFTRQDGLVSEQFQPNSVLKASDGCIYFGTIRGFNSFYPYQIQVNQQLPPVYITQLEIGTEPIAVGSWHLPQSLTDIPKLDLWMNDRVFSLSFASLSYCSPEKNLYAYMLEGFDKQWNYVGGERKATYTNLPAGTYTFRVKATNNDGIWSDREAVLKIVVHPPYWLSTYAKIFYVVLFICLIWAFIGLRLKLSERRHRKELAQLAEQKEAEMQQAHMEFFTTIAHEIRTPVSLIIGPVEQLKEQQSNSQLEIIDRNAHRLLDLVNQLLDFRKADQQQEMHFQIRNVGELVEQVAAYFLPSFESKGVRFKIDLPEERLTAAIDPEGIRKVVSNLLSNANKYTRNRINLSCQRLPDGAHFAIEVADNGRGISTESQKRLFDPFYQAKGSEPGTGIGLSIVKRITDQHHGTVEVDSRPGEGTTFRIVLPLSQAVVNEATATTATPQAAPAAPTEEKRRMLIVDDNEDMLTFLVTTFMDRYDVVPARDGQEALELIRDSLVVRDGGQPTSAFDIVISDWMMDHMDGPELCHRLRQNPATERLPFILLTAKTDSQSKVLAMDRGVDAFIEKPFNVKYLEACILNLLKKTSHA